MMAGIKIRISDDAGFFRVRQECGPYLIIRIPLLKNTLHHYHKESMEVK